MFASHHWPRWGNARIQEVLRAQRDLYAHMNNQVLHLANQGVTINEIHNVYQLPEEHPPTLALPRLPRLAGTTAAA
jgi:alkyl sulfatase BDS1-like metallo-beta-lactamase superfamily hydrolase